MKSSLLHFLYRIFAKPLFFNFDPEFVHDRMLFLGSLLGSADWTKNLVKNLFYFEDPMLSQKVAEINFKNPVGLAAGFDKNASLVSILPEVGFGFEETGTVTFEAYGGNPKPRLYRLPKSKSIVVNYGLKNIGAEEVIKKLKKQKKLKFPLSISIGKTNCARTADSVEGAIDYFNCLKRFHEENVGDFYVLNISCPNTFGGEPFTTSKELSFLLEKIEKLKIKKPIFLKMPSDLSWQNFDSLLKIAINKKITGVIIANLNKNRKSPLIKDPLPKYIKGSLSGYPAWRVSNELISKTYQKYGDKLIIIGVGGIFSGADAYEKIKRGATLVQLITGMIFEGPQLIGQINRDLKELLERDGFSNISEAVGAYYRKD